MSNKDASKKNPSLDELRNLYKEALAFKVLKSWEWMYDSEVFGIENPENGEIGYCCIMGHLGQVFAMAVYLGSEGLDGYLKTASGKIDPDDINSLHVQKCLMASFENREYLEKKDLQTIEELGLKFRGKNEWPLFRNYCPGYRPWYLNRSEVIYLTMALQQAIDVCQRYKENKNLLKPPREGLYFVRVAERQGDATFWKDKWLKPKPLIVKKKVTVSIDELRLKRIERRFKRSSRIWEVDFFYSPFGIKDKERPYFPLIFLMVDHDSREIINFHLTPHTGYEDEFLEKFLITLENMKYLPMSILVKREETYDLLESVSQKLGININFRDTLDSLEEAQENMFDYFSQKF